jgi:hypothetical protein
VADIKGKFRTLVEELAKVLCCLNEKQTGTAFDIQTLPTPPSATSYKEQIRLLVVGRVRKVRAVMLQHADVTILQFELHAFVKPGSLTLNDTLPALGQVCKALYLNHAATGCCDCLKLVVRSGSELFLQYAAFFFFTFSFCLTMYFFLNADVSMQGSWPQKTSWQAVQH